MLAKGSYKNLQGGRDEEALEKKEGNQTGKKLRTDGHWYGERLYLDCHYCHTEY